jgi:hypothetical protein
MTNADALRAKPVLSFPDYSGNEILDMFANFDANYQQLTQEAAAFNKPIADLDKTLFNNLHILGAPVPIRDRPIHNQLIELQTQRSRLLDQRGTTYGNIFEDETAIVIFPLRLFVAVSPVEGRGVRIEKTTASRIPGRRAHYEVAHQAAAPVREIVLSNETSYMVLAGRGRSSYTVGPLVTDGARNVDARIMPGRS